MSHFMSQPGGAIHSVGIFFLHSFARFFFCIFPTPHLPPITFLLVRPLYETLPANTMLHNANLVDLNRSSNRSRTGQNRFFMHMQ